MGTIAMLVWELLLSAMVATFVLKELIRPFGEVRVVGSLAVLFAVGLMVEVEVGSGLIDS